MNKVIVCGNNTKDIELRKTQSGKSVCEFTIAANERRSDGSDVTEFIDCRAWDRSADNIAKYVKKGHKLLIEGKWHKESYEDREGRKVYKTMVVVHTFEMLTPKSDTQNESTASYPERRDDELDTPKVSFESDDLPFY